MGAKEKDVVLIRIRKLELEMIKGSLDNLSRINAKLDKLIFPPCYAKSCIWLRLEHQRINILSTILNTIFIKPKKEEM